MNIYPYTHDPCNLEGIIMSEKITKWEVVMFLFCQGARVRIIDSKQWLSLRYKICIISMMIYFSNNDICF